MCFCNPIFKNSCLVKKNTLNFSFNNFPFPIIKLTIYLFLISGIIGILSTMYHGINLLWEKLRVFFLTKQEFLKIGLQKHIHKLIQNIHIQLKETQGKS